MSLEPRDAYRPCVLRVHWLGDAGLLQLPIRQSLSLVCAAVLCCWCCSVASFCILSWSRGTSTVIALSTPDCADVQQVPETHARLEAQDTALHLLFVESQKSMNETWDCSALSSDTVLHLLPVRSSQMTVHENSRTCPGRTLSHLLVIAGTTSYKRSIASWSLSSGT